MLSRLKPIAHAPHGLLAVSATLAFILLAAPAAAHERSIQDGKDPAKCKAPGCPDIRSAVAEHTGKQLVFRIDTYRAFSTKSALAPKVEVKVGRRRYLLTPKGGSSGRQTKFGVQVSRKGAKSIRYAVSAKRLGAPTAFGWRALIAGGGKSADRAPNKALVAHRPRRASAPQSATKLVASGARSATFTEDGACSSDTDPSGEAGRDWGGAWSTFANGSAWILQVSLERSEYRGAGTYSFPGRTSDEDAPTIFSDNYVSFGNGALTSWETVYTPTAVAGTMTIGKDLRSGTLNATLVNREDGTEVKLSGPFYCETFATD